MQREFSGLFMSENPGKVGFAGLGIPESSDCSVVSSFTYNILQNKTRPRLLRCVAIQRIRILIHAPSLDAL